MRVFLECNADETLALALGVSRKQVIHSHSKGRVAKALNKSTGSIGLVDEDPAEVEPRNLRVFVEVSRNHDIILKSDKSRKNHLVVICPRLDPWLIKTAKAAGLRLEDFKLSETVQGLDAQINFRLRNVEELLKKLIEQENPRLLYLQSLLLGNK